MKYTSRIKPCLAGNSIYEGTTLSKPKENKIAVKFTEFKTGKISAQGLSVNSRDSAATEYTLPKLHDKKSGANNQISKHLFDVSSIIIKVARGNVL